MLMTIFTDISFDPQLRFAAWAAWGKIDGQTFRHSAIFANEVAESSVAEVQGAVNGVVKLVSAAVKAGHRPSAILLQYDCTTVGFALGVRFYPCQMLKPYKRAKTALNKFLAQFGDDAPKMIFRHVKGHQGNKDRRSAVNSWCDEESRRLLRAERERRKDANVAHNVLAFDAAARRANAT